MALDRKSYPNALPTEQADYVKQNVLFEMAFLKSNLATLIVSGNIPQGAVICVGGTVYYGTSDTAITGVPSKYVKITPAVGGATASASYVANLAGVTWNSTYNGYYDVLGNLYIFDHVRAFYDGVIASLNEQYPKINEDGDMYIGKDLYIANDLIKPLKNSIFALASNYAGTVGAWTKATLDTTVVNGITGCSIAGSVISLPAGVYQFDCSILTLAIRVRNTTAGITLGGNHYQSLLTVRSTLAATSNIELQYWLGGAATIYGGLAYGGDVIYNTQLSITKIG